jgi:hypothetical protein
MHRYMPISPTTTRPKGLGHDPLAPAANNKPRSRAAGDGGVRNMRKTKWAGAFSLESLPLFATDDILGAALLGPERAREWQQIAPLLEPRGLPKFDPLMGGRYVPAVRACFDNLYGLNRNDGGAPLAPDGVEDFQSWKQKQKHRK